MHRTLIGILSISVAAACPAAENSPPDIAKIIQQPVDRAASLVLIECKSAARKAYEESYAKFKAGRQGDPRLVEEVSKSMGKLAHDLAITGCLTMTIEHLKNFNKMHVESVTGEGRSNM